MKYKANRPLTGDYGTVKPGQVFEVPEHMVKKMLPLEAKGIIQRHREPRAIKAYTVYENKAIMPAQNKKVS